MASTARVVGDVMSRQVVTLNEEQNLEHIMEGLERFGFRYLPVVDGPKLVGLVSQRDLLGVAVSRLSPGGAVAQHSIEENVFVAEVMQRDLATVRPSTTLVEAAALMMEKQIGALPVTDEAGNLVGIVTVADFLELVVDLLSQSS